MFESLVDPLFEVAGVAAETALFAALTVIGVLSEQIGFANVTSGHILGYWYVYVGTIALYGGVYLLGYQRLLPRLRERMDAA